MKKGTSKHVPVGDELRSEYDFSRAVRGKHYHPLHEGYTIKIHKTDGTIEVHEVKFEPGTVRLDPDLQEYFPDSQTVNRTLRSLLMMMQQLYPKKEVDTQQANSYLVREHADHLYMVNVE